MFERIVSLKCGKNSPYNGFEVRESDVPLFRANRRLYFVMHYLGQPKFRRSLDFYHKNLCLYALTCRKNSHAVEIFCCKR